MTRTPQMRFKNASATGIVHKTYAPESLKISFKAADDASASGTFEGYGAVYGNVDRDNEIIAPGAFAESLPAFIRDGFIACAHEWDEGVATVTDAYEDGYGLYIRCEFHGDDDSQATRIKTMERIARGKSVGLSVGFMLDEWTYDEKTGVRTITKATLYEVSIVTVPANPLAQVVAAKSGAVGTLPATDTQVLPSTVREFEKFLRDAGFSKSAACAIASKGFACGMQDEATSAPDAGASDDNEGAAIAEALYLQFQAHSMGVEV